MATKVFLDTLYAEKHDAASVVKHLEEINAFDCCDCGKSVSEARHRQALIAARDRVERADMTIKAYLNTHAV